MVAGRGARRPRNRLGDLNPLTFRPSKKMDLIQTQPTPQTSGASLRYIPGYVPMPFTRRELHLVIENDQLLLTATDAGRIPTSPG